MSRRVVVSMHDSSPLFKKEIEVVMRTIPQKKSFLVTPCWHGKEGLDKDFAALLKGEDTLLHGLTHQSDYFDPYSILFVNKEISREFLHLSHAATREKISLGAKLFENQMGTRLRGFIPPMWYHNRHSLGVLKEMGFCYTETWTSFINLENRQSFQSLPLSLDYGNNMLLSKLYLKGWKNYLKWIDPQLIRLAIHPSDVGNNMLYKLKEVVHRLEDNGYTFLTYEELLTASSL